MSSDSRNDRVKRMAGMLSGAADALDAQMAMARRARRPANQPKEDVSKEDNEALPGAAALTEASLDEGHLDGALQPHPGAQSHQGKHSPAVPPQQPEDGVLDPALSDSHIPEPDAAERAPEYSPIPSIEGQSLQSDQTAPQIQDSDDLRAATVVMVAEAGSSPTQADDHLLEGAKPDIQAEKFGNLAYRVPLRGEIVAGPEDVAAEDGPKVHHHDDVQEQFAAIIPDILPHDGFNTAPVAAVASVETMVEVAPPVEDGPKDDIQYDILPIVAEELEDLLPEIRSLLQALSEGDRTGLDELHRKVHTLKGVVAMAGAMKARALVHSMETWMEKAVVSPGNTEGIERIQGLFDAATQRIAEMLSEDPHSVKVAPVASTTAALPSQVAPRFIRISTAEVDAMSTEANEAKLSTLAQSSLMARHRALLQEMHENGQRLFRVQRELEIQAESQIASRRAQLKDAGEEFDPLEMDRFTKLQEISRFLSEAVSDSVDIYRSLVSTAAQVDTVSSDQARAVQEIDEGLRRARLVSADAIDDRLNKVVWTTARELGKSVEFHVPAGNSQGLDRQLLDRMVAPLEHVLRNAVAHGIEAPAVRRSLGKPEVGTISVSFRQEQGRLLVEARDDGAGLDPQKIKAKAVERGLWESSRPMSLSEAADMICAAGFSTATEVSQVAGRGVGMDVVRSEVLGMGGRFEISGEPGKGLVVRMFLPMAIASVSAVAVISNGQAFSIPVEIVEATHRLDPESHAAAIQAGSVDIDLGQGSVQAVSYADLSQWLGLGPEQSGRVDLVVIKEGERRLAFGVDRIVSISQFPLRPLGPAWAGARGLMGGVLLPDGHAAFLIDPARLSMLEQSAGAASRQVRRRVLVVDDSITVRKATAQMLEDNGFEAVMARDGRHALELLVDIKPCAILLDVEMPRMDGFECATHIKENPRLQQVPIAMITSRTAQKHRDRARSIGVEEYFGKPFREEDIIGWLSRACGGGG